MDLYTQTSYDISKKLTLSYSSSFGLSSRLFHKNIRKDIYAIYGLVRITDEIVDTYRGRDMVSLLQDLENEVYRALTQEFSTNMVVHAFASTAKKYGIEKSLIAPFFASMRMDIQAKTFNEEQYKTYIHGSAEVIGLMCLKVFTQGDKQAYTALTNGAVHLGSAYQKINFLRDMQADYEELGRVYFPNTTFQSFDATAKKAVVEDIKNDLHIAKNALTDLPNNAKRAVTASFHIYSTLLHKLDRADSHVIKTQRIRVSSYEKLYIVMRSLLVP